MNEEKKLAGEVHQKILSARHESLVREIFNSGLLTVRNRRLNEQLFLHYLKNAFSYIQDSQTPTQTLKNTQEALALLAGGK